MSNPFRYGLLSVLSFFAVSTLLLACGTYEQVQVGYREPMAKNSSKTAQKVFSEVSTVSQPKVQVALLLDTSGSMQGLIDQAKSQLWKIVNQFSHVYKEGKQPLLEVALYQYGSSEISSWQDFLKQVVPLGDDLDKLSEELFALRIAGSEEYCGTVIRAAHNGLLWSKNPADFKVMFIAGNETFNQGSDAFREMCSQAMQAGIVVNTIFCGDEEQGQSLYWAEAAQYGGGSYLAIDHNIKQVYIAAPQDKQIEELGALINTTYIPYGAQGQVGKKRQSTQDWNANGYSRSSNLQRCVTKGTSNYYNGSWDLVDACRSNKVKLKDLNNKQLPAAMQKMNDKEKAAYVKDMQEKRSRYQEKLAKLAKERAAFIAKQKKDNGDGSQTLDQAIGKIIAKQIAKKGFEIEK